jgi:catechol 2,3-dioxygenase-like lactoylglutathione lyase family enzyme
MQITSVDHVILPTKSLAADALAWQRLGLRLTPPMRHAAPTENQVFFVGDLDREFYVELLGVYDQQRAESEVSPALLGALDRPGVYRLMLTVEDVAVAAQELTSASIAHTVRAVQRSTGEPICTVIEVGDAGAGCPVSLLAYATPDGERRQQHQTAGLFDHGFPLLRLDHLAIISQHLDQVESFWNTVLGVATVGEVRGHGMLIRQLRVGDVIVEIIGPDGADSPLSAAPGGLVSMAAYEVADLDSAVELARNRTFDVPDGAAGVLPNSRVSTISGNQLGGLALQLIEFAR